MRATRGRAFVASLALAAAGLVASGCGIPVQQAAQPIGASKVEAQVGSSSATSTPTTTTVHVEVQVYLTTTGAYVLPEARYVNPHPSVGTVVAALLDGPTPREYLKGIQTALGTVHLLSWKVSGNDVTLNFNPQFALLSGYQEVLGVAQIVYTVASFLSPGAAVLFETVGAPIPVPVGTGQLVNARVHVSDYTMLLSPSASTGASPTTTTTSTTSTTSGTSTATSTAPATTTTTTAGT